MRRDRTCAVTIGFRNQPTVVLVMGVLRRVRDGQQSDLLHRRATADRRYGRGLVLLGVPTTPVYSVSQKSDQDDEKNSAGSEHDADHQAVARHDFF